MHRTDRPWGREPQKAVRLNEAVEALTIETNERKRAEGELREAHDQLEQRVEERTAELSQALADVESEVNSRNEAEERFCGAYRFDL